MQTVGSDPVSKPSSENAIIKGWLTQHRTLIGFFQYIDGKLLHMLPEQFSLL